MLTTNFSKSMVSTVANKFVANPYNIVILLSSLRLDMIKTIVDSDKVVLRGNLFSFFFTRVWLHTTSSIVVLFIVLKTKEQSLQNLNTTHAYMMGMGKTVTSVKIDDDTWKKVKIEAINQERQLSEILNEALKNWLTVQGKEKKK